MQGLAAGMGPTGEHWRILQIHPTRRCNLRCIHCYSTSGPEHRDELDVTLLRDALSAASSEAYTVAGFSGGEPLLYEPLPELLHHAHQCGMITTVTSNGILLNERRLEMLTGAVDLLAISLDGVPESHNRIRASNRAFESMVARLEGVRRSGIPFGFIFTLTLYNLDELDWVANFALNQGAKLLQIHPLEEVGRAKREMEGARPDEVESAYAYLEMLRIQAALGNRLRVHLDLFDRELLCSEPERVFADDLRENEVTTSLADLVSPLVIEPDGTVVPIQYGFDRRYSLGNLNDGSLSELAACWRSNRYQSFRDLCQRVFKEVTVPAEIPFFNWYEIIGQKSRSTPTLHS